LANRVQLQNNKIVSKLNSTDTMQKDLALTQAPIVLTRPQTQWHAYAAVAVALTVLSFAPIWARFAQQEQVPSLAITFSRMALSALILTPLVIHRYSAQIRRLQRSDLLFAALAGLWFALSFTLFFLALENTTVIMNEVLGNSSPIWVAGLEVVFLKARLKRRVWLGIVIALTGGIVIALAGTGDVGVGRNPVVGGIFSICGAITYANYLIIGRKVRMKVAFIPYVWLVYGFAAVVTAIGVFVTRTPLTGYSPTGYFWILVMVLIPQLIGHSAYNYALGYLSATLISVTGQMSIVTSGLLGFLVFGEVPSKMQIPGSIAIVIGVLLVSLGQAPPDETQR
jgi:drug/metabolite transporter (DMT)-like permease